MWRLVQKTSYRSSALLQFLIVIDRLSKASAIISSLASVRTSWWQRSQNNYNLSLRRGQFLNLTMNALQKLNMQFKSKTRWLQKKTMLVLAIKHWDKIRHSIKRIKKTSIPWTKVTWRLLNCTRSVWLGKNNPSKIWQQFLLVITIKMFHQCLKLNQTKSEVFLTSWHGKDLNDFN